jgi:hypothetical protein
MEGLKFNVVLAEEGLVTSNAVQQLPFWESSLPLARNHRARYALHVGPNAAAAGKDAVFFVSWQQRTMLKGYHRIVTYRT